MRTEEVIPRPAPTPDTPLPWDDLPSVDHYDGDENPCGESLPAGDEDYVLHACNAYPKLVEMVKQYGDTLASEWGAPFVDEELDDNTARRLLKELGEL